MMLPESVFATVVASTPLISIDLVIKNTEGQVLLGLRNNKPAEGFWFVPGGRILKNESITAAFERVALAELDKRCMFESAHFLGVYQHFYEDCFSGNKFSTHYVVLGYELTLDLDISSLPSAQHNQYRWFSVEELLVSDAVHQHSKDYFCTTGVVCRGKT